MTPTIILWILGGGSALIAVWVIVAKLKRAKIDRSENKAYKKHKEKSIQTEKKKKKIREKHNEKTNDIISNPNDNSMSNGSREHNHAFRESCGKDCPAYTGE